MSWWQSLVEKIKSFLGFAPKAEAEQTAPQAAEPAAPAAAPEETQEVTPMQAITTAPPTIQAYLDLKNPVQEQSGLLVSDAYPAGFQATDFPLLAQQGEAKITGNNQAYFFVANPKGNTDPAAMQLDTGKLKALLENVYDNKTRFTLAMDADALDAPEQFVAKYQSLRPEPEQATREALLGKEVELIGDFIHGGGVRELVREVIAERNAANGQTLPSQALDSLTEGFLKNHFRIEGIQTAQAMDAATWQIDAADGMLLAKQSYQTGTENTGRKWQIGTLPELAERATGQGAEAEAANAILDAANRINDLPVKSLLPPAAAQAKATGQAR